MADRHHRALGQTLKTALTAAALLTILLLTATSASAHVGVFAGGTGQGDNLDPSDASATQLAGPAGVAIDSDGSVLVVDAGNHRVLRISADGRWVEVFAGGTGQGDNLDPNDASATQLNWPTGVAIDSDGSVLITDTGNHRVLRISADGRRVEVFAGGAGEGNNLDLNDARATQLALPAGVAIDSDGSVLIADTGNHRVLRISADGRRVEVFAGGVGQGDNLDPNDASATQLDWPTALAIDSDGSVLIADTGNHRVLRISAAGRRVEVFAGGVGQGDNLDPNDASATQLDWPTALAIDSDGSVLIADSDNNRVLRISADGRQVELFAGGAGRGSNLDPNDAHATQLALPAGLAIGPDGSILISNLTNHHVLLIGANDAYERKLNDLIAAGAESDLRLLAAPTANVLRAVSRAGAGLDRKDKKRRKRQLTGEEAGDCQRLAAAGVVLPTYACGLIAAMTEADPIQSIWRLRARFALDALRVRQAANKRRRQNRKSICSRQTATSKSPKGQKREREDVEVEPEVGDQLQKRALLGEDVEPMDETE